MFDNRNLSEYYFNGIRIGDTELLFCGHQQCIPGHSYGPFVRSHYLLVHISSGKGIFRNQTASYTLTAGSTFCIFPGEMAYYQADLADPWEYYWIAFHERRGLHGMEHFLLQASISQAQPIHITDHADSLCALYAEMFQLCQIHSGFSELKIMSLFLDIMYHYVILTNQYDRNKRDVVSSASCEYTDRALEYIQAHYQENISVSTVAHSLGISREYLCALFRKHLHLSPARFIREYRLKSSTMLLVTTDLPILQIADMSGFHDYNYYSSQFRKTFGISPSRYRLDCRRDGTVPDPFRNPKYN